MTVARPLLVEQVLIAALMLIIAPVTLAQPSQEDLAKAAQNPIASLISVPIISQPGLSPGQDHETGIGNTFFTAFFVPKESGKWVRGVDLEKGTSRTLSLEKESPA